MLGNVAPTEFDLRFSIFGIPIRVHPLFWVVAAFMGWNPDDLKFTWIWIACVFVSILIHELGHAIMAKIFGWPPQIILYHFGGLAVYQPYSGLTTQRSIIISAAGPMAGFILFGIVWVFRYYSIRFGLWDGFSPQARGYIGLAFYDLIFINLYWGLINLAPVLPLDGGHICEDICKSVKRYRGDILALQISMVVAGGLAVYFFSQHMRYAGIMFALFGVFNFQMYQQRNRSW
ncbi:M50 family metallopeptidase [Gimesia chilikensis]|uniref:M50 family metallopeptidase n=1 Tax=Gimesia chilikensis TaxID=2605989 RepID=UPI00118C0483|nr:M50 family metallopeptidase [Gimesia chilikensis]QDT83384.1 Stage IV sporulation protein FB [Gimesia chilikensis]